MLIVPTLSGYPSEYRPDSLLRNFGDLAENGHLIDIPPCQSIAKDLFNGEPGRRAEVQTRPVAIKVPWALLVFPQKEHLRRQAINQALPKQMRAFAEGSQGPWNVGFSRVTGMLGFAGIHFRQPRPTSVL